MLTGRLVQILRLSRLTFYDNIPGNLWSVFYRDKNNYSYFKRQIIFDDVLFYCLVDSHT
jgi:hypothetical protein